MRRIAAVTLGLMLVAGPLAAEDNRYSSWSDPAAGATTAGDTRMQEFLDRLDKLIDEAEKARAADPVFLRDLRDLARGFERPWTNVVLDDGFADGDFTQNPTWEVLSGEYFIEQGWGLRNRLIQPAPEAERQQSGGDDIAKVLLGQILKQATGAKDAARPASENAIVTRVAISNAFAIDIDLSSWVEGGHLEIGVFQGADARLGYRLLYVGGKGLQLHRVGSRGSSVVETSAEPLALEDKKFHHLQWTRGSDGKMTVAVDGVTHITVTDRAFSDPFDGLRFSDKGGDYIVRRVTVSGT